MRETSSYLDFDHPCRDRRRRPVADQPGGHALRNRPGTTSLAEAERGAYGVITTDELGTVWRGPGPAAGGHPPGMGVRRRSHEGAVVFPMEPTWWARWSKKDDLRPSWARTRSGPSSSTETAGLSPQRLGGPGGRFLGICERLSRSVGFPGMGGERLSHGRLRPIRGRPRRGSVRSGNARSLVRLGHGLDPAGHLFRRHGPESDALRLSADSHHRVLFRRAGRAGQGRADRPRAAVHRRTGPDQLHPGHGGGHDRGT
jgi:hypothetical protein